MLPHIYIYRAKENEMKDILSNIKKDKTLTTLYCVDGLAEWISSQFCVEKGCLCFHLEKQ